MKRRAFLLVAAGAACAPRLAGAQDPRLSAPIAAAREWLALTDRSDGAESYKRASARFRAAMDPAQWSQGLAAERGPRGALVARTLTQSSIQKGLFGLPDVEFAVLVYRTAFAQQAAAGETVTLEREADGVWRVVGYAFQ